jgi:hypothetical protein
MMEQISVWFRKTSRWWLVLVSMLIFIGFMVWVLPDQSTKAESYTGEVSSPDTSLYYTPNQLYKMAEVYGEEGRSAYITARLTFDFVWPLVYTLFLSTSISLMVNSGGISGKFWQQANLFPILGLIFDYLENITAAIVMARFPNRTPVVDLLAGIFTSLKWLWIGLSFIILVIVGILFLRHLFSYKKQE